MSIDFEKDFLREDPEVREFNTDPTGPLLTEREVLAAERAVREFDSGATRDQDQDKPDYEGFLSPAVLRAFGRYMHHHRHQSDGSLRASDNWQKGIPQDAYMKSGWRHFMDWWCAHRGGDEDIEEALCALIFNAQGYLHEHLKGDM